jgi:hypothetical protein
MSYDGRYAYLQLAGLDEVHIIDLEQRKPLAVIEVPGKPIPFDKEKGRKYLSFFNEQYGRDMKADYPDRFPLIERIVPTREGHLIIIKSEGKLPDEDTTLLNGERYLVYDQTGKPIPPSILDLNVWRIGWLDGPWIWVNSYNEALDEHTILRCPRPRFEEVIARYPLFD